MKISNNSAIVRSYKFLSELTGTNRYPPYALCPFMRRYIYRITKALVGGFLIAFFVTSTIQGFVYFGLETYYGIDVGIIDGIYQTCAAFVTIVAALLTIFFILAMFGKGLEILLDKSIDYFHGRPAKKENPNVYWQWLKSFHSKICPTIEFTSE
jgi:hypothetical protein